MKRAALLIGLMLGGIVMSGANPALAAGLTLAPTFGRTLPFPRSLQAQSVWASDTCRNVCQSYCTWGLADCLQIDSQGLCLRHTDSCDRACQRDCRTRGGPFLPID